MADDSAVDRTLLRALLDSFGYATLAAEDGVEAVDLFRSEMPDLVFMDIEMPRMNGYEAVRRIREIETESYIPIVFLTSNVGPEVIQRCADVGGDEYFSKPFDPGHLGARLQVIRKLQALHDAAREESDRRAVHDHQQMVTQNLISRIVHGQTLSSRHFDFHLEPAALFSGDLILSTRTPSGAHRVLLGDVTGHGLPASVAGLVAANVFHESSERGDRLLETTRLLNRRLFEVLPDGLFIAAAIVEVDYAARSAGCWLGGIPPILVRQSAGLRMVQPTHPPLGIVHPRDFSPELQHVPVEEGDRILLYSDGLVDASNPSGEVFGDERLRALAAGTDGPLVRTLADAVARFRGPQPPTDDLSLAELAVHEDAGAYSNADVRPATPADVGRAAPAAGRVVQILRHSGACLRVFDHTGPLRALLGALPVPPGVLDRALTVSQELVTNAMDHGVLGLSSELKSSPDGFMEYARRREEGLGSVEAGWVELAIWYEGEDRQPSLRLRVRDSGAPWFTGEAADEATQLYGRGLKLARDLASTLVVGPDGNFVEAVLTW